MDDTPTIEQAQTIEQATKTLQLARERYDAAARDCSSARNRETDALNALNAAQKEFDSAVTSIKKGAPVNSEWHISRMRISVSG